MTVAFYAPLKAPNHPVPSGDRTMARALLRALEHGGYDVALASEMRIFDGTGDRATQSDLRKQAEAEVHRILAGTDAPTYRCWVTYHNYYKAPDLIGPEVTGALGIPYMQVESTRARKRLTGPWARFAAAAEAASDHAHTIFFVTQHDADTLRRDAPDGQVLVQLPPFLPVEALPAPSDHSGPMLSVGMMRSGDKLASYALVAETLARLAPELDWRLDIAGDGPAQAEVTQLMAPFGGRVRMLGALSADAMRDIYSHARLLFWPGVNEAFGYAYLEAQAAGLPVVCQDRPGVRDVVAGMQPAVADGPDAMAARLTELLQRPDTHRPAVAEARLKIAASHLLQPAAANLRTAIEAAI